MEWSMLGILLYKHIEKVVIQEQREGSNQSTESRKSDGLDMLQSWQTGGPVQLSSCICETKTNHSEEDRKDEILK